MAEKIDVLMPKYSDCPFYTVDTSGPLSVSQPSINNIPLYVSDVSDLMAKFNQKDNIRLLSCGFYIPESYTFANTPKINQSVAGNELVLTVYKGTSGTANAAVSSDATSLTDTRLSMTVNAYAGYTVYCNGKTLDVTSNTATKFVGGSWSGGGNPGNGHAWNCTYFVAALPGLGPRGVIAMPFANYEIALDLFCDMSSLTLDANDSFFLYCNVYANNLSMVGVPTKLDNAIAKIIPFVKILHTLDITP